MAEPLLKVEDLVVRFPGRRGSFTEVIHGVSFEMEPGKTLSLVGESGSGKTTIGRAILGSGAGERGDDHVPRRHDLERLADPTPQARVGHPGGLPGSLHLAEPCHDRRVDPGRATRGGRGRGRPERVRDLLDSVGLPADAGRRYPREFSGGQRQRIAIARALALEPAIIVCDEPDQRSGRHDAGASSRAVQGAPGEDRRRLPVHQPRPRRRQPGERPDRACCTRARSSSSATLGKSRRRPSTPTPTGSRWPHPSPTRRSSVPGAPSGCARSPRAQAGVGSTRSQPDRHWVAANGTTPDRPGGRHARDPRALDGPVRAPRLFGARRSVRVGRACRGRWPRPTPIGARSAYEIEVAGESGSRRSEWPLATRFWCPGRARR